jgi:hypothetical protein
MCHLNGQNALLLFKLCMKFVKFDCRDQKHVSLATSITNNTDNNNNNNNINNTKFTNYGNQWHAGACLLKQVLRPACCYYRS